MPIDPNSPQPEYCWGCEKSGHAPGDPSTCTTLEVSVSGTPRIHLTHLVFHQGNFHARCGDCTELLAGPERDFADAACRHAVSCPGLKATAKPPERPKAPTWLIGWAAIVALILIILWIVSPSR